MIENKQIKKWVEKGIITEEQAEKILEDIASESKQAIRSKLVGVFSGIGALLIGLGVILFIGINWAFLPSFLKVLILISFTGGVYWWGYMLKYYKKTLVKVGGALMFLSALLFGATIALIGQIYHIEANAHILILLWWVGVIPLAYFAKGEKSIVVLMCILFLIWLGLFFTYNAISDAEIAGLPILYLVCGLTFFEVGRLHYLSKEFSPLARVYRIVGLHIGFLALFLMSFEFFAEILEGMHMAVFPFTWRFSLVFLALFGFVAFTLWDMSRIGKVLPIEKYIELGIMVLAIILFIGFPAGQIFYFLVTNLSFVTVTLLLASKGYERRDARLINAGMGYFSLWVVARYIDVFWGMFPSFVFFIVLGIILLGLGVWFERSLRRLKEIVEE